MHITHDCVKKILIRRLQTWAEKLYFELWNCGEYITNRKSLQSVSIRFIHCTCMYDYDNNDILYYIKIYNIYI